MIRVFAPLRPDHPSVGEACARCEFPLRVGERPVLIPKFETVEGNLMQAGLAHATCALAGLKTPAGVIERIKDGDGSPFAVILVGGKQARLQECGLEGDIGGDK